MALCSIGEGGVHNVGGESFGNVGFTTGLILLYLDRVSVGMPFYYACGQVITHADDSLRVQKIYYAGCRTPTALLH